MTGLVDDPLWFRDAVIYEIPVRAFHDSNGDGIGDFRGLIEKLDYLQDIGITAVWLLPFYPSPLRDGGYDIADYVTVNPEYGTLRDFKLFMREAHSRGIRVITELVINHTSSDHPWFQRARRAPPGSRHRDFYVWSDAPDRYRDARIIFQDFETSNWTWDPVAKAYFWHRFYSHQPDLNFENKSVHRAVMRTLDFWLDMGVDGMRLDAVPYLYEADGTDCENLAPTHDFLRALRSHVDRHHSNRMLLAEANQWPEDAAAYFGNGDECHMNFHFPLMPRMFMSVELENSFPIIDILQQTPAIPDSCQWATFLRNHDELTLEMVTDEDRDYMYRAYAKDPRARVNLGIRRRLAPLMGGRRKIELMNGLLFSLPGTPVVYYGDEIGMGDNIYLGDRDGVRTPMQWSSDRNAGFSRANPQQLYLPVIIDPEYHFEAVNVEAQQNNAASLLWWMKRLIAARKEHPVFGRGDITFLHPDNSRVLAFLRRYKDDCVLVVANLSRFAQHVELELRGLDGL
ncbi:MAG: maltose alpha-D-glucosyltransferase, partial [Polyangiaceae bacterium]|nr:maltose alpha-D-glucosyltransferase [Polyangiaceae bacterium]